MGENDEKAARQLGLALERLRELLQPIPDNAVRDLRGDVSVRQLATKSELTHAQLSRIENGERPLTPRTAKQLADALDLEGVTAEKLEAAQSLGHLKEMAAKSSDLDASMLMQLAMYLNDRLPEGEYADQLIGTLVELIEAQLAAYKETEVATKSRSGRDVHGRNVEADPLGLGLKSRQQSSRDSCGVQQHKRYAPASEPPKEESRRRRDGTRINKPYAPRDWR